MSVDSSQLEAWAADARAAWPDIEIPHEQFVAHLARHAADGDSSALNVIDLYLACACATGHPKAIAELEARCIANAGKAIWQVGVGDRDDVLQQVREQLLLGTEPLIARYAGRGSLRGWVRSIVLRTAIKHSHAANRAAGTPLDEEQFLELAASSDDPRLAPYKERYREAFRAAFRAAVEALAVRQRNILRQYFLDHSTIDELGAMYRVHRSTASRWIQEVRETLVSSVRKGLASQLADSVELRGVIDLVASQLELSLERLVRDDDD